LDAATNTVTEWLNAGCGHTHTHTDVLLSGIDGSVYTIIFVFMGNNSEDHFVCEENETDFMLWKLSQQLL